ncbi:hypothetical protein [Bacteroides reticulotermitis]|uniref:hypothetical protein n=1 Tax=Bacteroides reticulotermitis TaxID=1133319 RepID=UPI003A84DA6A
MLFYLKERDLDFYNACERIREVNGNKHLSISELSEMAIHTPAESFYLLPKECLKIISRAINGEQIRLAHNSKNELHKEIRKRYFSLIAEQPDLKPYQAAKIISTQDAPRFYISKSRARDIYYKMINTRKISF